MPSFILSTELQTTPASFWQGMSMAAVNAELWPLVRMTVPHNWKSCPLEQWATGQPLFRSVILLFGVVPVDIHSLQLAHIDPERGFVEKSSSWVNKQWQHERRTEATRSGCIVTDTVTVQGRIAWLAALLLPVYKMVFRHRHRRLAGFYGFRGV